MTSRLDTLVIDANKPLPLARFWAALLGWNLRDEGDGDWVLAPTDGTRFELLFEPVPEPKVAKHRIHLDLTSTSLEDQRELVERSIARGARRIDVGQGPDAAHVVLADPEGNEFCVIEPGNAFLAGCGRLGSITCDGSRAVGLFWSAALGWPLVWDQDDETAIRAPDGAGPFITFGPPVLPKAAKNRLHLDITPLSGDQGAEVDRLVALGAVRIDIGQGDVSWVVMADPDGNEFCVLDPRPTTVLAVPARWDDVTADWMTSALSRHNPHARVAEVTTVLRDDGTNRRARFGMTYRAGSGPVTVFVKAESDVPGRREIHEANGNLYNEALLYRSGVDLPLEHPHVYVSSVDEANLDYVIVMEDLVARDAEARHALLPFTVEEAADGLRGLARLHSRFWGRVDAEPALEWVQPFLPTDGLLRPMRKIAPLGLERVNDALPDAVKSLTGEMLVDTVWAKYLNTLNTGPQTLLHGDPHIGNTYTLPGGVVGFLDWQVVRRGNWSHDVGYFLQSALTEEDRRRQEADLVEEYRTALDVPQSTRPGTEEAWLRYRATPVHGLTMWIVTVLSDVHVRERSVALVERYATAYADLDTAGAVAALG